VLPHRGQGLNNAICDAANIVDVLVAVQKGEQSLSDAIKEYEDEM
jgi:2-polyprenyl-6-methoxyphenol hydroxylase-like FAD-dependent oxidoreductase